MHDTISPADTAAHFTQQHAQYYDGIEYYPLSSRDNEIRLLRITPTANQKDPIICHLEHASLNDSCGSSLNYVALSYYWGDAAQRDYVLLAGQWISITSNLYRALLELRTKGYYLVWADGLCINQADLEEKSQQLLRMATIYRSASLVVSYLDSLDPYDRLRSDAVSQLSHDIRERIGGFGKRPQGEEKNSKKEEKREASDLALIENIITEVRERHNYKFSNAEMLQAYREAFMFFLGHEYWTRAWIIQEISVNPHLEIIWGGNVFDLDDFMMTLPYLNPVTGHWNSKTHHLWQLSSIRRSQIQLRPLALLDALKMCHRARASIHQDRVFALLSLTHDGPSLVPLPSYEMPMEKLSRDMTIRMIQATGKLDLVVIKNLEVNRWYPDWFDPQSWVTSTLLFSRGPEGSPHIMRPDHIGRHYRASRDFSAQFGPYTGDPGIRFKGLFIGQVTACSPTLNEAKSSMLDTSHITVHRTWKESPPGTQFGEDNAMLKTLRWLLVGISDIDEGSYSPITRLNGFGMLWNMLHRRERLIKEHAPDLIQWMNCCEKQDLKINGEPFVSYFSRRNGKSEPVRSVFPYICQTIQWNLEAGMKLGGLDGGQLGWLHKNTTVGDKVVVFLGSSMPCVVRPRSDHDGIFTIVGPCIIAGVMHGGAVKDAMERLEYIHVV